MSRRSESSPDWRGALLGAVGGASWRAFAYVSLGLAAACAAIALWVVALAVGLSFGLLIVGLPVAIGCFYAVRAGADVERWRAAIVFGEPVLRPYRPISGRLLQRLRQLARDPATWRDLLWLVLLGPIGIIMASVSWSLWGAALGLVLLPLYYLVGPGGELSLVQVYQRGYVTVDSFASALPFTVLGLALCLVAGWATRWMAVGQARLARGLLGPSRVARLDQRVATLAATRATAADAQARELRRIERDLHDGAQARLAALGADLGMAAEAFDSDPVAARTLIEKARENAEEALVELRELIRGVSPPILSDRGLNGALDALAARSAVPVQLTVGVTERLPAAVETAVYFVVAETLTNVARHAGATAARVDAHRTGDRLLVRVSDDGCGGADLANGTGLRGLRERLAALDGSLLVDSPAGGPTVVIADIPCAS